jgi:hypothetical protein
LRRVERVAALRERVVQLTAERHGLKASSRS